LENTRIYKVLNHLSTPVLNRFIKFLKSPYHNVNANIEAIAALIIKQIKYKENLPSKTDIWVKIFKDQEFDDLKFRKLCNETLERFETFLTFEALDKDKLLKDNLLLQSLKEIQLEDLITKHISKSKRDINRQFVQSSNFFLNKYLNDKILQNLKSNYERKTDLKTYQKNSHVELLDSLDSFYTIERLRLAIDILTWEKMYKSPHKIDQKIQNQILEEANNSIHPTVQIYGKMYALNLDITEKQNYYELKEMAFEHISSFPKDEQKEILDVLVSFCIKLCNKGEMDFFKETLAIYDWGIKEDIVFSQGRLSPTTFRNYVMSGLRVGEFDKIENFITHHSKFLDENRRENALNFNLGRVSFYRKEYQKVIQYLNLVNYDDIWYNINSKVLLFASYYELDEIDVLISSIEAFSTFLRREKDVQNMRTQRYSNFSRYLKKIVNNKHRKDKIKKINEALQADSGVVNKPWLLEKMGEILK